MEQVLASENRVKQYFDAGSSGKGFKVLQGDLTRNRVLNINETAEGFLVESIPAALEILKEHGAKAKIFCIHSSRKTNFIVRSNKHDWEVMPLKKSNVKVPSEYLKMVNLLLSKGIQVEKLYIGKAVNTPVLEIAKAEVKTQARVLSEESAFLAIKVLSGVDDAVEALREARENKKNAMSMISRYLPDPVLLARIKGHKELVEIGRWL